MFGDWQTVLDPEMQVLSLCTMSSVRFSAHDFNESYILELARVHMKPTQHGSGLHYFVLTWTYPTKEGVIMPRGCE